MEYTWLYCRKPSHPFCVTQVEIMTTTPLAGCVLTELSATHSAPLGKGEMNTNLIEKSQ